MSTQTIWRVVRQYSPLEGLVPHDLRRTFAQLAAKGKADLTQLQKMLDHTSIQTTAKYIGADLDLSNAPSDVIQLDIK